MSAPRAQCRGLTAGGNRPLLSRDCSSRFERNTEINLFAIGDSTLNPAGEICFRDDAILAFFERIVVFRTPHPRRGKSGADFESFGCWQAQHSFCEISFQFIENGRAQTDGNVSCHAFDRSAEGIALRPGFFDQLDDLGRRIFIRAPNDTLLDRVDPHSSAVDRGGDLVDLHHIGDDFDFRK